MKDLFDHLELDAVLITDLKNLMYLTGFGGDSGVALITRKKNYLITIPRHYSRAVEESYSHGFEVVRSPRRYMETAYDLARENSIKVIGMENRSLSHLDFCYYKSLFTGIEVKGLGDSMLHLRQIKSETEVEKIRKASEITDLALSAALLKLSPGMTELELAGLIEYYFKKHGAEDTAFRSIVASGERSALPHSYASPTPLKDEGFLLIDIGCTYRGYCSDMTRTLYLGSSSSEKHIHMYNTVLEANRRAISAVRPGITSRELDSIARSYIEESGYGEYFDHGLGHGVGIDVHELPSISPTSTDIPLRAGMVITIEPGIYIEGLGGVRIEDCVLVTEDSYEILSKTSKNLTCIPFKS